MLTLTAQCATEDYDESYNEDENYRFLGDFIFVLAVITHNLSFGPSFLTKHRILNGLAGKVLSSEIVLIRTLIYSREVCAKRRSTRVCRD